ncbi:MAG: pantoate--beta-alanine ligase [Rhodospirillaceae bacterium]|nr:pantoate--beta-alanine ligase [Rhodospirillaceae bacterium]
MNGGRQDAAAPAEGRLLETVRTVSSLRAQVRDWRSRGETVGLVPTMGALHDGHLALVQAAQARCDRVIATIFVNPAQFGPTEDFGAYPRTEAEDADKLRAHRTDLLFAPGVEEIYPGGFATAVHVAGVSEGLCGGHRPGHFDGVATVVSKLLLQALPDAAFFGEKDYQQLQVIKRVAADLDIPVEIVGVLTVREADGLALSSRNVYLDPAQRRIAPALYGELVALAAAIELGENATLAIGRARRRLVDAGFDRVEYVELRDPDSLAPVGDAGRPARLLAAAWLGRTRLIDNIAVGG